MSTSNKLAYGGATAITITLNSLANASQRQSASVDNSANLFLDALVTVTVTVGIVSGTPTVAIYVAGSADGTAWPGEGSGNKDGVTGSDAAITLESPTNLNLVCVINVSTSSKTYTTEPFSIANCFGGVMPSKWSLIVDNESGAAFSASGCSAQYNGLYSTNT